MNLLEGVVMKKKILIVHLSMVIGGVEKVLLSLLDYIDYEMYSVDLYLRYGGGALQSQINPNVNIIILEDLSSVFKVDEKQGIIQKISRKALGIERYYYGMFRKFFVDEYDISISFQGLDKLCDLFAGVSPAKKKFIWVHGDFYALSLYLDWFKRTFDIDKYKYDLFDKVICVSESSKESFLKLHNASEVDYIWNFINDKLVLALANEEPKVKLTGSYKIVFVGRFVHDKNLGMLIEALNKVKNKDYVFMMYLIGNGPLLDEVKSQVERLDLNKNIVFLGELHNPYPVMKQADLLVLPSRNEGFPTVLLESLVLSVPFVVTDVCGSRDIAHSVAPTGASILVKSSVEDLEEGIIEAMSGRVSKMFSFNGESYNLEVMRKFEKVILSDEYESMIGGD